MWTCGVNDDAALGRVTQNIQDPNNPDAFLNVDELTSIPHPLQSLIDENFRAVQVAAGDSVCAAVSDKGDLRVWGTFRVSLLIAIVHVILTRYDSGQRRLAWLFKWPQTSI